MLVGMIVLLGVGLLCLVLGALIWKKQRIDLIQAYHVGNVKREDIPAYTRQVGLGLSAIGAGCVLTGVLVFGLEEPLGWIALGAGFVLGLALTHRAQKRWNGGWFSG